MGKNTKKTAESSSNYLFGLVWLGAAIYGVYFALGWAYKIRILALEGYGYVIHEFDPYFNYRATEYLYNNGAERFFKWFDYMSWYPLGRPVGSTIYPGMQFTAVFLKNYIFPSMSLNDVCCSMPAWFGMLSTFLVGCIAYECSLPQNCNSSLWRFLVDIAKGTRTEAKPIGGRHMVFGLDSPSVECALGAMGFMAIVPAHLMRSVGGGYDNESVAVSAMSLTFYLWVRSLRGGEKNSYIFGVLTGIAYFYMVAAWGGYVFVLNMVGVHAAALTIFGRFSTKVYAAYSLFYSIGTFLAMQIPVVGMTPLKSLEQMGPCLVFLGFQVLQLCEILRKKRRLNRVDAWKLRIKVGLISAVIGIAVIYLILPKGYFGPISSRVRGLFVKHTKTGNPLVDSVAEHQAASPRAYFQYLHNLCLVAPVGFALVFWNLSDSSSFLLTWGASAYFFSHKMVRLVLLTAPIASVLGGIAAGRVLSWCIRTLWDDPAVGVEEDKTPDFMMEEPAPAKNQKGDANGNRQKLKKIIKKKGSTKQKSSISAIEGIHVAFKDAAKSNEGVIVQRCIAGFLLVVMYIAASGFKTYCWQLAPQLSNPSIMMKGRLGDGNEVIVDDYREAYWWLRDNTPEDSRIMAWWDYGYQITAIANRTTIADGNTWNHEHIALLGKALTTTEDEGYEIARHLADYVLVWAGGGGDDLAKSPHLARIANSVYRDHCSDPACRGFGFTDRQGTPSVMMERSFLYKLHGHNMANGVKANARYFQEVFRSKYGKVRIFKILGVSQESKDWVSNPENRLCDVPGSWYCPGQYPPGLQDILSKKTDFAQLEDFNRGQKDAQYQKDYFESLANPKKAIDKSREWEVSREKNVAEDAKKPPIETQDEEPKPKPTQDQINEVNGRWENSEASTLMWELITKGQIDSIKAWLKREPLAAFVRSEDGRGPMWWAFESRNQEVVKLLMRAGVSHSDTDKYGKKPASLLDP